MSLVVVEKVQVQKNGSGSGSGSTSSSANSSINSSASVAKSKHKSKSKNGKRRKKAIKNRKVGRWFLGETLGKGGYSWVKKGYDRKDGRVVALKFTSKAKGDWSPSQSKQVQNEIEALRQIKHKHVLQLLAYNLNAKYPQKDGIVIPSVLLVLEYLPGGELFDILYYTCALTPNVARTYFAQLMDGMHACHDAGICHRDIKPQNLLLDANFQLKIADFGLAKVFQQDEDAVMRTFYVGTRGYQAPEILKKKQYTVACDLFSCGVVLFILLAGYPPFEAATPKCRWYAPLATGNAREFWKQHRGCGIPAPAKDLITRMLWYDWRKRISIRGIKNHKWFNGETLSPKNLASDLRKLHRLMEIKRRDDAEKQSQLQDSIKRDMHLGAKEIEIYDCSAANAVQMPVLQTKEFYSGCVIENVAEIVKAELTSDNLAIKVDCTAEMIEHVWDAQNQRIVCDRLVTSLALHLQHPNAQKIAQDPNAHIRVMINDERTMCNPPQFPENEAVTLKDVFTTCHPRLVLGFIKHVVLEFGGTANLDFESASMKAHLATHNFPAPITIQVRIFLHAIFNCYLVKFERIGGDSLHFGRVLHQLTKGCGPVLTGLPNQHFGKITAQEMSDAQLKFGDLFNNQF